MGEWVKKPGLIYRATAAFALLNLPLIGTAWFVFLMGGNASSEWWLRGILAIAVAASEIGIVTSTIGPPLVEWIDGKEFVADGKAPSWREKP